MTQFVLDWPHFVKDLLSAGVLVALMALFISWRQLRYSEKRDAQLDARTQKREAELDARTQKRDAQLDARNQWEKVHKAMVEFRFRREILNAPMGLTNEDIFRASHALQMLCGELDRAPDSPLITEISKYLSANQEAQQWRADAFVPGFDKLAHQAALKARE
jgi:hypothetical protein